MFIDTQHKGWEKLQFSSALVTLLCLIQLFLGGECLYAADKVKAQLIVSDVLTTPGKPAKLQANVFEEGLLGRKIGLGGESLEFLVQGKVVGTTMSGGDGRAYLEYTPRMRGNLGITVRLSESPRVFKAEGTGLLASWERRKPILLVELTAIVKEKDSPSSSLPSLPINLSGNLGDAETEAIGELEKLGKFYYNLIYLHRSTAGDQDVLQQWIQTNEFPAGFPKVIPVGRQPLSDWVTQLKERGWENVTGGIGRTKEFADVLVENRIKAVVLHDPEDKEGFPRRAVLVKSWAKVRKHL